MALLTSLEGATVAPPSWQLSGGRPARRAEGETPSGQPAEPALSIAEGMPALQGCQLSPSESYCNLQPQCCAAMKRSATLRARLAGTISSRLHSTIIVSLSSTKR